MNYTGPITNEADAQGFLFQLHQAGNLFHPDDNPADIIRTATGEPVFTAAEAEQVTRRMNEVFEHLTDPYEYALTLTDPITDREPEEPNHYQAARNMMRTGGSFAAAIGEAFLVADSHNAPRLMAAFPELFTRYATK